MTQENVSPNTTTEMSEPTLQSATNDARGEDDFRNTLEVLDENLLSEAPARVREPQWLRDRRMGAYKQTLSQNWPDRKLDEYWRSTPFSQRVDVLVPLVEPGTDVPTDLPTLVVEEAGLDAAIVRIVDGAVLEISVPTAMTDAGLVVTSLVQAANGPHAELVREHLGALTTTGEGTGADDDRTITVNDAAWDAGVFIHVPNEVELPAPVVIHQHITRPGAHLPRVLIVQGRHSRAIVELEHTSVLTGVDGKTATKTPVVVSEVVEAFLGDGAGLHIVSLNEFADDVTHLALHKAQAGRDAEYRHLTVTVGGKTVRIRPEVDLVGPGASTFPRGMYFADEGQFFDLQPYIRHLTPRATSDVLYKGALQGASRTVFRGNIFVHKDAVGTDTNETNRTLILTPGARADSTPFLEIECADITAGHGSATGQIDERSLYYLMARGIPRDQALRLIVRGFFREVLTGLDLEGIEDRAMGHVERELALTPLDKVGVAAALPEQRA